MDLYFILKSEGYDKEEKEDITLLLKRFHLLRFAAAVMWVEREVFGLQEQYMLCEPDENSGRYFLQEIISEEDWSYLKETEDNRITLITCVENQPKYRRCIQAIEI